MGAKQKGMASMALEEHNANHSHHERSTAELSFDELAKDVASGTLSRRKALRLLGAALVGGAFASMPGVAWAAKGGNRECVRCCKETYGPGRERGQCISAGARGECPVTCDGNGGLCPPESCCCVCRYTDKATGQVLTTTCQSGVSHDFCQQFLVDCEASQPPESDLQAFAVCPGPADEDRIVCSPVTGGSGCATAVSCTSPPA